MSHPPTIIFRNNGHATNTAIEIDGRHNVASRDDEFEQDDDGE